MHRDNTANTSIIHHSRKTHALVEIDYPFHFAITSDPKYFDIESFDHDTFGGQLKHNLSAHPKVNRKTGEFLAFGYDMFSPCVHFSLFNSSKKLINYLKVSIDSLRFLHDFGMTENYAIIPDTPIEVSSGAAMKDGGHFIRFDHTKRTRYGVFKKLCQNTEQVQWFEFSGPHMLGHVANAWEDKDENGNDVIYLYGCT